MDGIPLLTAKTLKCVTNHHDTIAVNALASLGLQLRGKPCRPKTSATSIRTWRGTRRPDVLVECGKPDPRSFAADDPRVVIEILSPSTMRYDRFQKLAENLQHPSIKVILLVDSEAPQVAVWRCTGDLWSTAEAVGLDAVIDLPEIGTSLPLAELYLDMTFEPGPT